MAIIDNRYRSFGLLLAGCLSACTGLCGCAGRIQNLNAPALETGVKHVAAVEPHGLAWYSPILRVSRWRTRFCCYDTVAYRLAASESTDNTTRAFRLLINASYGGAVRHYDRVRFPDASNRSTKHRHHDVMRCQFFNSLIYACLYRDHASVDLTLVELEKGQLNGMRLILASEDRDYETIDLPADFIHAFLAGVK